MTKRKSAFRCRKCGACCRIKNGIVRVSDAEIARIAAFLGTTEAEFINNETDVAPDRHGLILKSRPDGACAWLTDENLCRINPVKPDKCRSFPDEWTNSDSHEVCPGLKELDKDKHTTLRLTEQDYRKDAVTMAKALLGATICRRLDDGTVLRARIVETEAYYGEEDTACHAHKGRTQRTDIMYSPGGFAYVYLCYGMHNMLNVVTGPADHPEAVLIRGVEGAVGPGRVTKALQITLGLNRENLVESEKLWIEMNGAPPTKYKASPRVGIAYASKRDQARKWRFVITHAVSAE